MVSGTQLLDVLLNGLTIGTDRRYKPRAAVADEYAALYDLFSEVSREMRPIWAERAAVYDRTIFGQQE